MTSKLRTLLRFGLPLLLILFAFLISQYLMQTAPTAKTRIKPAATQWVEVLQLAPTNYITHIQTQGVIQARTQTKLIAEVSGRIMQRSVKFQAGSFVKKGDILIEIDDRDYAQALIIAQSDLAQARLSLEEESAKGEQALAEWNRLGFKGEPNQLTLRKPQYDSAKARVSAAQANIAQAHTKLERAVVRAPYDGRIKDTEVDIAQFVNIGNPLGSLYTTDSVEIRVPISASDSAFLALPTHYQDDASTTLGQPPAIVSVQQGGQTWDWQGTVTRTEGTIDVQTQQQFIIIRVPDPYRQQQDNRPPLIIGQFAKVSIEGITLEPVLIIPRESVYAENELQIVLPDNTLERRPVEVLWQDDQNIVIGAEGLTGVRIIKTPLGFASNGMSVTIKGAQTDQKPARRGKKGGAEKRRGKGKRDGQGKRGSKRGVGQGKAS